VVLRPSDLAHDNQLRLRRVREKDVASLTALLRPLMFNGALGS
jgi:hypothetical protein